MQFDVKMRTFFLLFLVIFVSGCELYEVKERRDGIYYYKEGALHHITRGNDITIYAREIPEGTLRKFVYKNDPRIEYQLESGETNELIIDYNGNGIFDCGFCGDDKWIIHKEGDEDSVKIRASCKEVNPKKPQSQLEYFANFFKRKGKK